MFILYTITDSKILAKSNFFHIYFSAVQTLNERKKKYTNAYYAIAIKRDDTSLSTTLYKWTNMTLNSLKIDFCKNRRQLCFVVVTSLLQMVKIGTVDKTLLFLRILQHFETYYSRFLWIFYYYYSSENSSFN